MIESASHIADVPVRDAVPALGPPLCALAVPPARPRASEICGSSHFHHPRAPALRGLLSYHSHITPSVGIAVFLVKLSAYFPLNSASQTRDRYTPMGKLSDLFNPDRYRSEARQHALTRSVTVGEGLLPTYDLSNNKNPQPNTIKAGGLDSNNACGPSLGPTATGGERNGDPDHIRASEKPAFNKEADHVSSISSASAAPPIKSEATGAGNSAIVTTDGPAPKPSIPQRMTAGCKRFGVHLKNALFYSKVNILLVAVPVGIIVKAIGLNSTVVFSINAVAIIPLAGLLAYATESVAKRLGDTWGALLNVSFGNAVELIIFIIALAKGEIRIVQASILGSILANLLLILGMAFLLGGLRFREQIYNSTVTQMSACLLSLSVASLILPVSLSSE